MPKLYPLVSNQAITTELLQSVSLKESLPYRPYCTDSFTNGIRIRSQAIALTKPYIQLNPPQMQHWLVFDIDRPLSAFDWEYVNLPMPFAVVVNPKNSHCHVIYRLATPVCVSDFANLKPLRYLADIERAMTEKLRADSSYGGFMAKNPFCVTHWHVLLWDVESKYELSDLAEWLDLTKVLKRNLRASEVASLGRNCFLFDKLRQIAYKSIKEYRNGNVTAWCLYILDKAVELNQFTTPLDYNEVKAIAKSVAKWTWKNMSHDTDAFKQRQSVRGKKGGIVSGQTRLTKANNQRVTAQVLKDDGMTLLEIARTLGMSVRTIHKWKLE